MGHNLLIRFSEGRGNLGKVKNVNLAWDAFKNRFRTPTRTRETFAAYQKLTLPEKQALKSAEGFFFAAPCRDGSRKKEDVLDRDILTIDIDENALGLPEKIEAGTTGISHFEFLAHSTRSHSPEKPKLRIIIPTSRQVKTDEHAPLSRIVSQMISPDMRMIDPVSHRLAQMMFKPSCSKDSEYLFYENEGDVLDPDAIFDEFRRRVGDPFDFAMLPVNPDKEGDIRATLQKAEDPTTKDGPVGVWCRAYTIDDVIAEHLSDIYVPAVHSGSDQRYTAVGSQGNAGCVVYDDGKFMFSHHTSDPCSEQLVNAWDIVRLCLFGEKDVDSPSGTKIGNLPSSKAMLDFAMRDRRYRDQQIEESFDLDAMLDDDGAAEENEELSRITPPRKTKTEEALDDLIGGEADDDSNPAKEPAPAKDWIKELETDKHGGILPTFGNCVRILTNDFRIRGALAFNELEGEIVATRSIKTKNPYIPPVEVPAQRRENGEVWTDLHDATLRGIMAEPNGPGRTGYGMDPSERTLREAVMVVGQRRKFHPIREMLTRLKWDGTERLESVPARYLGCPDDAYHREAFRNTILAAVARAFEPGHKFDNILILEGRQGARKSTFIEVLALRKWFLELTGDLSDSKAMAEQTRGAWFVEMAEMAAHRKSEADIIKSWLSRRDEKVRMAYARKPTLIRRQFVPIGTTNESTYLKDPTGARRFWPMRVQVAKIDIDKFESEVHQMFAEAVAVYQQMRTEKPHGDLWLDLRDPAAVEIHQQIAADATTDTPEDELAGRIEAWLEEPVPMTQVMEDEDTLDNDDYDRLVLRTRICPRMVWDEVLGNGRGAMKAESMFIARAMDRSPSLQRSGSQHNFPKGMGKQRFYYYTGRAFTVEEKVQGWAFASKYGSSERAESRDDDLI